MSNNIIELHDLRKTYFMGDEQIDAIKTVSYTHLTLPTNREV